MKFPKLRKNSPHKEKSHNIHEPKGEHIPGLCCPRCHEKGIIVKIMEKISTEIGKLDFPYYKCVSCHNKWYDSDDVTALMLIYGFEKIGGEKKNA